jgi:hypothetical protein
MAVNLRSQLLCASKLVSESRLLESVNQIWANDRWFTYPAFQRTAKEISNRLQDWGVVAETCKLPADGRTIYGDWKMPLGWDCTKAKLELIDPKTGKAKLIADRQNCPTHVVMWAGPTPKHGLTGGVVQINKPDEITKKNLKGKFVYTPLHGGLLKCKLLDAGILGVITSWSRSAATLPDACFWFNGWSDEDKGWAFHEGDTPIPAMAITPRMGKDLEDKLKKGSLRLRMTIHSSYSPTMLPIVSGYVPGKFDEEVLAIGHTMEQGANDNASGGAVIMESLRVLNQATKSGALSPLKRGVRGLFVNECYGTIGYAAKNRDLVSRMIAGVNWDTVGRHQESDVAKFHQHRCPDASASVADTLMTLLLEAWLPKQLPHISMHGDQPFVLTDNAYCDPELGVHCPYVNSQDVFWHTSHDTPERLNASTLHVFGTISVAYLHFLASAGCSEALWLAEHTLSRYAKLVQDWAARYAVRFRESKAKKGMILFAGLDHLDYLKEIGKKAIHSAERLMLPKERIKGLKVLKRLELHLSKIVATEKARLRSDAGCKARQPSKPRVKFDISTLRPKKKFIGTPTYDGIPSILKKSLMGSPVWSGPLHCALFWADGSLSFDEIVRRVNFEFISPFKASETRSFLEENFKFMAKHGLIEWQKPPHTK